MKDSPIQNLMKHQYYWTILQSQYTVCFIQEHQYKNIESQIFQN